MVQNVMGSACLKLIDFGDARIVYNDNYIHEYAGSAEFRAPEVIRGQAVSTLTDVWYTHVVCSFICFFIMQKNNFTLIYMYINYFISIVIIALNNLVKRVLNLSRYMYCVKKSHFEVLYIISAIVFH